MMRLIELKDTFVGKALAVFVSVLLATSLINVAAFATGEEENSTTPYQETIEDRATEEAPAQTEQVSDDAAQQPTADQSATEQTDESATVDDSASQASGSDVEATNEASSESGQEKAPANDGDNSGTSTEQDNAGHAADQAEQVQVQLKLAHATLVVDSKTVASDATNLTADANKKLEFKAVADTGYELDKVKAENNGQAIELTKKEGAQDTYTVAASDVANGLTIKVETKAVEEDQANEVTDESKDESAEGTEGTEEGTDDAASTDEATEGEEAAEALTPEEEMANEIADEATNAMESVTGAVAKTAMLLNTNLQLPVTIRYYNAQNQVEKEEKGYITSGVLEAMAPAKDGYYFLDATISTDNVPIAYAEAHDDGRVYYALEENALTGILLGENETIYLNYKELGNSVRVHYTTSGEDNVDGNEVIGSPRLQ